MLQEIYILIDPLSITMSKMKQYQIKLLSICLCSSEREATMDCKLHWFLKFCNHIIFFVGSTNLCIFIGWFQTFSTPTLQSMIWIKRIVFILLIFIGDVYKFIVNWLIPLEPFCSLYYWPRNPFVCIVLYLQTYLHIMDKYSKIN